MQIQKYELLIQKFIAYCQENKLTVSGHEKVYKSDNNTFENENGIIARFALFKTYPLLIEMYDNGSLGLYYNLFQCDPLTSAILTKKFIEEQNVSIISSFVEMKNMDGEIQNLLFGNEAFEQYIKEKMVDENITALVS